MPDPRPIIYLTSIGLIFWAGWKVRDWQGDAAELAAMQSREAAMQGAAEAIARIKVENKTVYQKAQTTVIREPVYQDCRHSDVMYKTVNEALK